MRSLVVCLLVSVLAACMTPPITIGKKVDQKKLQRRELAQITPAPLESTRPWKGEPRRLKVRVYLDEDFRSQTIRWKQQIEEQFDDANQFLEPALGIRLEVVAYKPWAQRSASESMETLVRALEAHDQADDVAWVVA